MTFSSLLPAGLQSGLALDALFRELKTDGAARDGLLDGLVLCAATECRCPVAAVILVGQTLQWLPARLGIDPIDLPREGSLCAEALSSGDPLVQTNDLAGRERFCRDPLVQADPRIRFMACAPFTVAGVRLGALCVMDTRPRRLGAAMQQRLACQAQSAATWLQRRLDHQRDGRRRGLLDEVARDVSGLVVQLHERSDAQGPRLSIEFDNGRMGSLLAMEASDVERDPRQVLDRVLPEDRARLLAAIEAARETGDHAVEVVRLARPGEGTAWMSLHFTASPREGGGRTWNIFAADLSEHMRAEAAIDAVRRRWQTAVEAAELGLVTIAIGAGQVSLDARAAAQHRLGFSATVLPVEDWLRRFELSPQARSDLRQQLSGMVDGQTLTLEVALRAAGGDAPAPRLELIAQASPDEFGQLQALGTCRDVTMRLQMLQLRSQKEAAEQASREKTHFLSRVSHELRTPLNAILGFTDLLCSQAVGGLGPRESAYLARIADAGRLLLRLVDDLLELQRTQERPLPPQPFDATEATLRAASLLEGVAVASGIRVVTLTPPEPIWASGDPHSCGQVLLNLISNGIKYNRPGGSLRVQLRQEQDDVRICVEDEGGGLPAERLERLFQPFERLGAEQRGVQGHGLGLTIAKQLAESMGGRLEVSSRAGVGTTFTLVLARARTPAIPVGASTQAVQGAASSAAARHATLVLIEDEPVNALLFQEALRMHPRWEVLVAGTGAQGLALARERQPDLLIVDVNLPDASGLDVVRAVRRDDRTRCLRCVAFSADALPEQVRAAQEAGFDAYWTKPVDVARLPEMIAALLDQPRSDKAADLHVPTAP